MPNRPKPNRAPASFHEAIVVAATQMTPHMVRITFSSDLASGFSPKTAGGYVKLIVPEPGKSTPPSVELGNFKKFMRTYTIRHVRASMGEFDVDFVAHGDVGLAAPWAAQAKAGDKVLLSGPGPLKFDATGADRVLLAADMSAIPAAAAILEALDPAAVGNAYFEIFSEDDRQSIRSPSGVAVHWIVKSDAHLPSVTMIAAVTSATKKSRYQGIFVAGEFSFVAELRAHLRSENLITKRRTYISSYWKLGLIEPEHKAEKARVA